jgi:hypothetical protein
MTKVTVQIKSPPPTGPSADVMIQVENADGDLCTYVPEHVYDNVVLQLKEKLRKHVAAPRCRDCGGTTWKDDGICSDCRSFPTLGFQIADYIEASCVIPDREQVGDPFLLTDEQLKFLLWFYRIRPSVKKTEINWKSAVHVPPRRPAHPPQKWGKGPFAAAIVCGEAAGPAVFDGWDAAGQPVGKPWPTPLIQITAISEDQAANVWSRCSR